MNNKNNRPTDHLEKLANHGAFQILYFLSAAAGVVGKFTSLITTEFPLIRAPLTSSSPGAAKSVGEKTKHKEKNCNRKASLLGRGSSPSDHVNFNVWGQNMCNKNQCTFTVFACTEILLLLHYFTWLLVAGCLQAIAFRMQNFPDFYWRICWWCERSKFAFELWKRCKYSLGFRQVILRQLRVVGQELRSKNKSRNKTSKRRIIEKLLQSVQSPGDCKSMIKLGNGCSFIIHPLFVWPPRELKSMPGWTEYLLYLIIIN